MCATLLTWQRPPCRHRRCLRCHLRLGPPHEQEGAGMARKVRLERARHVLQAMWHQNEGGLSRAPH